MMNIEDLPNEMLIQVASLLPMSDLKSLSQTCHRFNDIVGGTVMLEKGVLWLNKAAGIMNMFGRNLVQKQFIDLEVLQRSLREYRAIGINLQTTLSNQEFTMLQKLISGLLSCQKAVRDMYVYDSGSLQIVKLYQNCPTLFETLEGLSVKVSDAPYQENLSVEWNMPNLRWIEWNELRYHSNIRPIRLVQINLNAPQLQDAKLEVPKALYVSNQNFHCVLVLKTVEHLKNLYCVLGEQAVELLSNNRLPALKRLCLIRQECSADVNWDIIASNTPNLQFLELKRGRSVIITTAPLYSFLRYCSMLNELHLDGLDISDILAPTHLWQGIVTLHLHECEVYAQHHPRMVFKLPNVRKLCASFCLPTHGELVLHLPKVEMFSLSKGNESLDILEMPQLTTLHLRVSLERQMTFMAQPLPHLRNLIMDTPPTFVRSSEQNYRMLLAPNIKLTSLTVVCRSGRAINDLLVQLNKQQPQLIALKLIGSGVVSRVTKNTIRSVMKLPHLQSLLITNIQLTGSIPEPYPLPREMRRLRIRSLYTPCSSRFVSMRHNHIRLGNVAEHRVLHHNLVFINATEIPIFEDIQGTATICIDSLYGLFFDD